MAEDPNAERHRLTSLYSKLSDGELLQLASDQQGLTDVALNVLEIELRNRRIQDQVKPAPEIEDEPAVDLQQLVPIRKFLDVPDAWIQKGLLESAGIECFLSDENMVRIDWLISNMLGGVKLLVRPEDAVIAEEILSRRGPEIVQDDDADT